MGTTVFSTKIRKLRKEAGYTQDKVSRMLNIQRQTYSNYENALRVPPLETIVALSGIYHVTLDSLLLDQMPALDLYPDKIPAAVCRHLAHFHTVKQPPHIFFHF